MKGFLYKQMKLKDERWVRCCLYTHGQGLDKPSTNHHQLDVLTTHWWYSPCMCTISRNSNLRVSQAVAFSTGQHDWGCGDTCDNHQVQAITPVWHGSFRAQRRDTEQDEEPTSNKRPATFDRQVMAPSTPMTCFLSEMSETTFTNCSFIALSVFKASS